MTLFLMQRLQLRVPSTIRDPLGSQLGVAEGSFLTEGLTLSIQNKIVNSIMLPVVVVSAVLGVMAVTYLVVSSKSEASFNSIDIANKIHSSADMFLSERIGDASTLAKTAVLAGEVWNIGEMTKILNNYRNNYGVYSGLSVISRAGTVLADANHFGIFYPYANPLPKGWQNGELVVEDLRSPNGQLNVVIVVGIGDGPIYQRFVVTTISRETISSLIVPEELGWSANSSINLRQVNVMSHSGTVIASTANVNAAIELSAEQLALEAGGVHQDFTYSGLTVVVKSAGNKRYKGNPWLVLVSTPSKAIWIPVFEFLLGMGLFLGLVIRLGSWRAKVVAESITVPVAEMLTGLLGVQDGKYDALQRLNSYPDELGELAHGLWVTAGIIEATQQKLLEGSIEARLARDAAESANLAKSQFLANMSHEIRTPLNGIIGFAQSLDEGMQSPEQKEMTSIMVESGHALLAVINDILDVSKIESGHMTLEAISFSLAAMAQSTALMFDRQFRAKKVALQVEMKIDDDDVWVIGDMVRIKQIFINLMSNALKFTSSGAVIWRLKLDTGADGWLTLYSEVDDQGIGMTEAQLRKLFIPFSQADDSVTRKFGGTGLGLSIIKALLEMMGGEVTVESIVGRGTKFSVVIPLKKGVRASLAIGDAAMERLDPKILNVMRVLVAEDNVVNQKVATAIFKKIGVSIDLVENGALAVEKLSTETYDVVFMDLQMPVMDGLTAAQKILAIYKESNRTLPLMAAMTANVFVEDRERAVLCGLLEFVPKPIRRDDIERVLRQVIHSQSELIRNNKIAG
jgi:signal transduction histidine kinase/ActR/RegA family two-component response regulator